MASVYKPGARINIIGNANGANFEQFRIEWAKGINPGTGGGWSDTGVALAGDGIGPVTDGLLATWDSAVVTEADFYSIRLIEIETEVSNLANTYVYFEPDLYSTNWPRWLDQAPGYASVLPARDASGQTRLVLANPIYASTTLPSRLWIFALDGSWFTNKALDRGAYLQPAVADLDGAAGDDIIAAEAFGLRVFNTDGASYALTPPRSSNFQYALATLADLNADGQPEIIALGHDLGGSNASIYAWKTNGLMFNANYPVQIPDANLDLRSRERNRVVPLDVDADGKPELLVVGGDSDSSFSLRIVQADGTLGNWPTLVLNGSFHQLAVGELDNDGTPSIVLAYSGSGVTNLVQVYSADGVPRAGWPKQVGGGIPMHVLLADLNRDGRNEIIVTAFSVLCVFEADGSSYPGAWPLRGNGFQPLSMPVVGDIDGDGFPEIIAVRDNVVFTSPFYTDMTLVAYRENGTLARSWRLLGANGNQPTQSGPPLIGDFDGDGNADLAVNYRLISGGGLSGSLHEGVMTVLRLPSPYRPDPRDWPAYFHDARNSSVGFIAAKLRVARSGAKFMLTWPLQTDPAVVQFSDDLGANTWGPLSIPSFLSNGLNTITVDGTADHGWYRLQYQ